MKKNHSFTFDFRNIFAVCNRLDLLLVGVSRK